MTDGNKHDHKHPSPPLQLPYRPTYPVYLNFYFRSTSVTMAFRSFSRIMTRTFLLKEPNVLLADIATQEVDRTYTLFDLICLGVGGTIGSGVFVLTGIVANSDAGPGVIFSWLIAGFACFFSCISYAELSCRLPAGGSSYQYVYAALGELPACIAAWCLSLEYSISGAAVAASWGTKVLNLCSDDVVSYMYPPLSNPKFNVNIFAGLLQLACVLLLLWGVQIGRFTVNFITSVKVLLVIFLIIGGLIFYNPVNMSDGFAPFGVSGIMTGATSCFFGYVGYDEVCCMGSEAKNPKKNLPRAVVGVLAIVTVLYVLASLALVGMQNYLDIDQNVGYSAAFRSVGQNGAAQMIAAGEIFTLPIVVLVSFLAQPRLMYAMASDGLIPKVFAELDKRGNMSKSIAINGVLCILISLFVDFDYLNDLISAGILVSFNLSNSALIQIRRQNPKNPTTTKYYLIAFNLIAIFTASLYANADLGNNAVLFFIALGLFAVLVIPFLVFFFCPEVSDPDAEGQYRVPLMPFFPFFAMFINYVLLSYLTAFGAYLFIAYSGSAVVFYYIYGLHYSVGNNSGWKEKLDAYKVIQQQQEETRLKDLEKSDAFHSKDHEGILQVQVDDISNEIVGIKVAV